MAKVKPNWEKRKKRLLLTENALVLITIYFMESGRLGNYSDFGKQDVVNESGRLYGLSNKTVLKAIEALKERGLVEIVEEHRFPFKSKLRLTDLGRKVAVFLAEVERIMPSSERYPELLARVR